MHIYYRVYREQGQVVLSGNNDDVASASWVAFAELPEKRILEVDQEFLAHGSFKALF